MCIGGKDKSVWFLSFLPPNIGAVGQSVTFCFLEISQLNKFYVQPVALGHLGQ